MTDSPYQPPKTTSEPTSPPPNSSAQWSQLKLLLLTFAPAFLSLICAPLMPISDNFIGLALFGSPILAVIIAVLTANNFSTSNGYSLIGQLIIWFVAHTALVLLGFVGCTMLVLS